MQTVAEMVRPHSDVPDQGARYGLGFWLDESTDAVLMLGMDAGVGCGSFHDRDQRLTFTVISNKTRGAWPVHQRLHQLLVPSN